MPKVGIVGSFEIKLRKFQSDSIDSIFAYFYSGKRGNPLVVAPTGSGKSIIIAALCKKIRSQWPTEKILVISHVKEILEQNLDKLHLMCPEVNVGVYSAGLGRKEHGDITVASIQSIYKKKEEFSDYNIIIIDEVHTVPHKGQGRYRTFLDAIERPVIGFTATPFRTGTGFLHLGEGALFDEIVYDIPIKTLIAQKFLSPITAKGTNTRFDAAGVKKAAGDYVVAALAKKFDRKGLTDQITNELLLYQKDRKKWLVFAIDINHAEHIKLMLNEKGIKTDTVHSKMTGDREQVINNFKNGDLQALVSVAVLTTGFDAPCVDLVVLLRPTASPVLHVQIIGRGMRIFPGKENCLVLDFAGNLLRNGPIDNPNIKIAQGDGTGEAIMKECPHCYEIVYAAVRTCPCCGHEFVFKTKLSLTPEEREVLSGLEWFPVIKVKYHPYVSRAGNKLLKVVYVCGLACEFSEYVSVQGKGYPRYKAEHWWKRRAPEYDLPATVREAAAITQVLAVPKEIQVDTSGKYPSIKKHTF